MIKLIKKTSSLIGIDGAIAFTILSRIIQAGGGIITLVFIAQYLTKVEQGYYYTFGSILAIQIFFELGLSGIITQFVAHENSALIWEDEIRFTGSDKSSSRLSSLLRFSVKWFSVISVILFVGLILAGYFFFGVFGKNDIGVSWQVPWIILSITTTLSLMISPLLAFFEGLGRVKEVAKIRLIQQAVQLSLVIIFFSVGLKLYSSPLAALVTCTIAPLWILLGSKIRLIQFILKKKGKWNVNYRLEIFPYQWKIAVSWISGYFIFQLFNPVLFATEGAIVAGQMGMTITVLNSIMALTFSWMTTKVPTFSVLIAQKKYLQLDNLFNKTLIQSSVLNVIGLLSFLGLIFVLRYFDIKVGGKNIGNRFLPLLPMLFMMIPIFFNNIIGSWAIYMRCHKEEPMLLQSVVIGALCTMSTIIFGNYYGVQGISTGYMILTIVSFVWTYIIFVSKKNEWHN